MANPRLNLWIRWARREGAKAVGAYIQSATGVCDSLSNQPNTVAITLGATPTVGNTLIVSCLGYIGGASVTMTATDNQTPANTYTRDVFAQNFVSAGHAVAIFSCPIVTASGTFTITVSCTNPTPSGQALRGIAAEFSGVTASPFDKSATNIANTNSLDTTAAATTTSADELLIAVGETQNTITKEQAGTAPASGWTELYYSGSPLNSAMEYQFVSSTVAARHVWTLGSAQWAAAAVATYKVTAVGGQTVTWVGYIG